MMVEVAAHISAAIFAFRIRDGSISSILDIFWTQKL